MTALSDAARSRARAASPLDAAWRARAESAQMAALPRGRVAVSCPAPFGSGGLGRHLEETQLAISSAGGEPVCVCEAGGPPRDDCTPVRRQLRWRLGDALARP